MIEGASFLTSALATRPYRVQSLPLRPHRWLSRTTIVIIGFVVYQPISSLKYAQNRARLDTGKWAL